MQEKSKKLKFDNCFEENKTGKMGFGLSVEPRLIGGYQVLK